ncbi:hypothetical protein MUNTM_38930 [Mycobacterium sp. MUNTM1]
MFFGAGGERRTQIIFTQVFRSKAKNISGKPATNGDRFEILTVSLRRVRGWLTNHAVSQDVEPAGAGERS